MKLGSLHSNILCEASSITKEAVRNLYSKKYKPFLNRILKKYGIHGSPEFKESAGIVAIYDNAILKFTPSKREAATAKKLVDLELPHVASVYGVVSTKLGVNVIVQEKVNVNIPTLHRKAASMIRDYIDNDLELFKGSGVRAIVHNIVGHEAYEENKPIKVAVKQIVTAMKALQNAIGVTITDMHGANLGFKNRNVALFDLGF